MKSKLVSHAHRMKVYSTLKGLTGKEMNMVEVAVAVKNGSHFDKIMVR